jgi:hypothetical protein
MKFYHNKDHDMWTKGCIPLGRFVTESDQKLDLGIWIDPRNGDTSFAIVYGDEGHQYISGDFILHLRLKAIEENFVLSKSYIQDFYIETIKRYNEYLKDKGENSGNTV